MSDLSCMRVVPSEQDDPCGSLISIQKEAPAETFDPECAQDKKKDKEKDKDKDRKKDKREEAVPIRQTKGRPMPKQQAGWHISSCSRCLPT